MVWAPFVFLPPLCSLVLCSTQPGISRPILDPTARKGYLAYTRTSIHGYGNGNPLQDSCLENPVDGGAWWAAVHRVKQNQTQLKQLSMHVCIGEGNGNPLQYSCLENPREGGTWWAAIYGVSQSRTRLKWLSNSSSSSSCITNYPKPSSLKQ